MEAVQAEPVSVEAVPCLDNTHLEFSGHFVAARLKRLGFHQMSREPKCVVKTFSLMKTRRDHCNSTKDLGHWKKKKNKKSVGRGKTKRRILDGPGQGVQGWGVQGKSAQGRYDAWNTCQWDDVPRYLLFPPSRQADIS